MDNYIFIIYSCKNNIDKANKLYNKIYDQIENCKIYIIYGDDNLDIKYKIIDDKYIVLNVEDDYERLNKKTLMLLQTINNEFSNIKGLFKCDDDVIVNLNNIRNFIKDNKTINVSYSGHVTETKEYYTIHKPLYKPLYKSLYKPRKYTVKYCGGPLYYLNHESIKCFSQDISNINMIPYEDAMVGYHLFKNNIHPTISYLYSNVICNSPTMSYHNKNHYDEINVVLMGGLGNQLFQLACAMKYGAMYNKSFVLNRTLIIPSYHQQNNIETTISTIKTLFPEISIENKELSINDFYNFNEEINDSFLYTEKISDCLNVYNNVILKGYFINSNYIPRLEDNTLFYNINIIPNDKNLLQFDFTNTYFIHIRLGDYLTCDMYQINLKNYYNYCIKQIIDLNNDAKFYICTNQYDKELTNYLDDFNTQPEYIIQDKTNNDIDTLFIMSSCCGAICSNSTLSYMGSFFQKNKRKEHIYMPYPYVNFVNGFNDTNIPLNMYPEWCNVYNTFDDNIIS